MSLHYPHTDSSIKCSSSFSLWEGPVSANATEDLIVTAVLESGARESFCGFHLVICCNADLLGITISGSDVGSIEDDSTDPPRKRKGCEILQAEQDAAEAANEKIRSSGVWPHSLPPYELTLEVYRLAEEEKSEWSQDPIRSGIRLIPSREAAPMRKLYEILVPDASSLFLYLRSNRVFRSNPRGDIRGILTANVRLIPPSQHRQPFQQPPSEILHHVFQYAYDKEADNFRWRSHFLSFALVCRAWRAPALDCLYEDLDASSSTDIDFVLVAKSVKRSPALGAAIRRLDHYLHVTPWDELTEQEFIQVGKAFIDIVRSAPGLQKLLVSNTHRSLKADLVQVVCSTRNIDIFRMYADLPHNVLGMVDLFSAFSHWKRLHTLHLYRWDRCEDILPECTPPLACPLVQLSLSRGHITGYQFQNLTAGAHATLTGLELSDVDGLTNDSFKSTLLLLAPILEKIEIINCQITSIQGEELALDAAAPLMRNVAHLSVATIPEFRLVTDKVLRRPLDLEGKVDGILALSGYNITLDGLQKMLESGQYGWKELRVQHDPVLEHGAGRESEEALLARVQGLAQERGVKLYLVSGTEYMYWA